MISFNDLVDYCSPHMNVWINKMRDGPTGHGYTFEEAVLDKGEDNKKDADFGGIEFKATLGRKPLASKIRLFTLNSGAEKHLLENYGRVGRDGKSRFCPSFRTSLRGVKVSKTIQGRVFDLNLQKDELVLQTPTITAKWNVSDISTIVSSKIANLAIVGCEKRLSGVIQYRYHSIRMYRLSHDAIYQAISDGSVGIEFRVSESHDHGTAFYCSEKTLRQYCSDIQEHSFNSG